MKKILALIVAALLALSMVSALAAAKQTKANTTAPTGDATITVTNPAKGETYKLYKIFLCHLFEHLASVYEQEPVSHCIKLGKDMA